MLAGLWYAGFNEEEIMQVKDCITNKVVAIPPETSAKEAFGMMKSMGIRHLVVVKEGVVLGIVTDRDLRRS